MISHLQQNVKNHSGVSLPCILSTQGVISETAVSKFIIPQLDILLNEEEAKTATQTCYNGNETLKTGFVAAFSCPTLTL